MALLQFDQIVLNLRPERSRLSVAPPLSFELERSEWLGIRGSALETRLILRLCNRLEKPLQGSIYFQNRELGEWNTVALRRKAVWVAGEPDFLGLSVQETLCYPLQLQNIDRSRMLSQLQQVCDYWQIPVSSYNDREYELSLLDRHRIVLARALMLQPDLLLLDLDLQAISTLAETIVPLLDAIVQNQALSILTTLGANALKLPSGSKEITLTPSRLANETIVRETAEDEDW